MSSVLLLRLLFVCQHDDRKLLAKAEVATFTGAVVRACTGQDGPPGGKIFTSSLEILNVFG